MLEGQIYQELIKDFPPSALSIDTSRGFALTSIDGQHVVERLNEVFGPDGWTATYDVIKEDISEIVIKCKLYSGPGNENLWSREGFGGVSNQKKRNSDAWVKGWADMYKGAMTNSLCKAASHLGVGNTVYKGLGGANNKSHGSAKQNNVSPSYSGAGASKPKSSGEDGGKAEGSGSWVFPAGKYKDQSLEDLYHQTDSKNPEKGDLLRNYYMFFQQKDDLKGWPLEFKQEVIEFMNKKGQ